MYWSKLDITQIGSIAYFKTPFTIFIAITSFFLLPNAAGSTANELLQYMETISYLNTVVVSVGLGKK